MIKDSYSSESAHSSMSDIKVSLSTSYCHDIFTLITEFWKIILASRNEMM